VATLRHWERGDCTPKGPTLALLNVIQWEPKAALRAGCLIVCRAQADGAKSRTPSLAWHGAFMKDA
jgi:hypothetical protein